MVKGVDFEIMGIYMTVEDMGYLMENMLREKERGEVGEGNLDRIAM